MPQEIVPSTALRTLIRKANQIDEKLKKAGYQDIKPTRTAG